MGGDDSGSFLAVCSAQALGMPGISFIGEARCIDPEDAIDHPNVMDIVDPSTKEPPAFTPTMSLRSFS